MGAQPPDPDTHPGTQWHRYWHSLWKSKMSWTRAGLARWVCREFGDVKFLRLVAMAPYNVRPGARTKPYKVCLWHHYCSGFKKEFDADAKAHNDEYLWGGLPKGGHEDRLDPSFRL